VQDSWARISVQSLQDRRSKERVAGEDLDMTTIADMAVGTALASHGHGVDSRASINMAWCRDALGYTSHTIHDPSQKLKSSMS
jgi:hypothetical protein